MADGDNGIRNIVRLLFTEKMGYRVVAVSKGTDAVLKAKEIIPDIVLADAYLSNKDGYQVAREIKSDPFLRAT
ncbi:MAG TPA: response regulator, partial [Thermodesulfobacteriota bacterium]